jgi:hypothetical protein
MLMTLALKDAVKTALDSYDSTVILQMLIQQGYDPFYAQGLIEEAEEDSDVITAKNKKSEVIPDESKEDLKRQQAQQEEDALANSKQQALLEQQQQAADDDADDDEFQDLAEQQYFNFAKGGPTDPPERTWSEKYQRMLTPQELAWLDQKFSAAKEVTDLYKAGNKEVAENAKLKYKEAYGDSFTCPNGQCDIPVQEIPEEEIPEKVVPEEIVDETEIEESEEYYYPEQTRKGFDPNFYIDMHGNRIDYRLPKFRKPGHYGDLIKKGKQRHLYIPSIERGPSTSFMIKGQEGIAVQTPPSFYDYAMSEMQRFLAMPEAWKGDPDFENADGTFNLCIDCLSPNYENEQDLRDMNRLIEEGFTREIPHYGKDQYMQGLTKYGIPMPIPGAKKVPQNAYGGLYKANFGMDVNPMPNAQYSQGEEQPFITWPTMEGDLMRDGGMPNKRSFLKKMTSHLMKANMGMEQQSQMPSPYGNVDNPTANDVSGKQNFVSTLNKQAQMFQAKKQAEQMYNNMYGMMAEGGDTMQNPLDMNLETNTEMQFGGAKNRRIRRANRALFGVPMMPPGTNVDYEFGPLGGLRRASAETDLTQLAELLKLLPGSPNANPLVTLPDLISQMGYRLKVNQGRLVEDGIADINNQSLREVAILTGNETATTKSEETPTINTSDIIPKSENKSYVKPQPGNNKGKGTGTTVKPPVVTNPKVTVVDNKNNSGLPKVGKRVEEEEPDLRKTGSKAKAYYNLGSMLYRYGMQGKLPWFMEEGGFVDAENPDLYKFIYGGDDVSIPYINNTDMYRNGGRILPQAAPGMESFDQFRLQKMNPDGTLKNKPSLPGGEELMGNPYSRPQQQPVVPSSNQNQPVWNPGKTGYRDPYSGWDGTGSMPWITSSNAPGRQQMNPQQMQQMQQYMQMMQQMGQQTPFAFGAPRGLGLGRAALKGLTGFSRDFNYMTGDNPGNWSIPEGMTNLRKETFKDRGKKFNPFDTKRVTTYEYSKPGEAGVPGAPGSTPGAPGAPGKDGIYSNTEGLSGKTQRKVRRGERRTARQVGRGMEEFPEDFREDVGTTNQTPGVNQPAPSAPGISDAAGYNSSAFGPGYSGIYSDANGDGIPDYLAAPGSSSASNFSLDPARAFSGSGLGAMERSGMYDAFDISQTQPQPIQQQTTNTVPEGPVYNSLYPAGMSSTSGIDSIYEPDVYDMGSTADPENVYFNTQLSNPGMSNPYGRLNPLAIPSVNLDRRVQAPGVSGPQLSNPSLSNPYSRPNPLSLGFAEGGFIPDYYTFDGYLPMADPGGIVSNNPDFQMAQDPNSLKYRIEEQSGFSFDPNRLGNTLGVGSNIASSVLEDLQSVGAQRFGSNKQNYARDIDRQLAYRGITDQEGVDKKAGFESGRTYTGKYGGQYKDGGQYKNGGTYSLTREQIDQIRKMGGDVEFI